MDSLPLVLASTSPYRRELLARLRLPFEVRSPGVDESILPAETPREATVRLAQMKARAVAPSCPSALVIASDQIAALEDRCLGKPGTRENALTQLKAMRGRCVTFHTALALLNTARNRLQLAEVPTAVYFRRYSDDEIERYLTAEQPYDCTGSARIEGLGIVLVERIASDDPTALVGLPLMQLSTMLRNEGYSIA